MALLSSVDISFITHATEDSEKTCRTVAEALGIEETFDVSRLEGHFANPIRLFKVRLLLERADEFAIMFFARLSEEERQVLRTSLGEYLDEHGNLYVRVDKQRLFDKVVQLAESEVVKLKLKAKRRGVHYDTSGTFLKLMRFKDGETVP